MRLQTKRHHSDILEFRLKLEVIPFKCLSKMVTFSVTSGKREPETGPGGSLDEAGGASGPRQQGSAPGRTRAPALPEGGAEGGGGAQPRSRRPGSLSVPAASAATATANTLGRKQKPAQWVLGQVSRSTKSRDGRGAASAALCSEPDDQTPAGGGGAVRWWRGKSLASSQRQGTKLGGHRAPVQGWSFTYLRNMLERYYTRIYA